MNASWFPDFIRQYHDVDVGVAVQTPGGLMVPVVRDADLLGLAEIGATVRQLAEKVRHPVTRWLWGSTCFFWGSQVPPVLCRGLCHCAAAD